MVNTAKQTITIETSYEKRDSRELARQPKQLEAVIAAAAEAMRDGVKLLEAERTKLGKELTKAEKSSLALEDRLPDPDLQAIGSIKSRLSELEKEQQSLKSRVSELTLQTRDRRNHDISNSEIQTAYEDFAGL